MNELISPPEKVFKDEFHSAMFVYQRFDTMFPLNVNTPRYKTIEELNEHIEGCIRDVILVNTEIVIKDAKNTVPFPADQWNRLSNGLKFFYDNSSSTMDICTMLLKMRDIFSACINGGDKQKLREVNTLLKYATNYLNSKN